MISVQTKVMDGEASEVTTPCNPENATYDAWLSASEEDKPALRLRLNNLLVTHAEKVCWMVLHQSHPHVAQEAVNELFMEIDTFQGKSLFSTWAHRRFINKFRNENRYQWRRLGTSMPEGYDAPQPEIDPDWKISFDQVLESLDELEKEIVRLRLEGLRGNKIAQVLGISANRVARTLDSLYKKEFAHLVQKH